MKVIVDEDGCRGHGTCCTICPEVFVLTDDGYAVAQVSEVPAEFEEAVLSAARRCPERAITTS